jgi:hypothetical protein
MSWATPVPVACPLALGAGALRSSSGGVFGQIRARSVMRLRMPSLLSLGGER